MRQPTQGFSGFEADQKIGFAGIDLRRVDLGAEADVRGHHAAALSHAGHFSLFYIVALADRGAGQHFGGGHHALAADPDHENVGDAITHERESE